jgi:hypothetical protein
MANDALDPAKYQQIVALLKQIRRGYADLGKANPFNKKDANAFVNEMGNANDAIITLVDALDDVDKQLDSVGKNAKAYYETFIGLNGAIKKQNEALNVTKRASAAIQGITEKLKNDQEDLERLDSKALQKLRQKYKIQQSNLKIANKSLLVDKNGNELSAINLQRRLASKVVSGEITQGHADLVMEMKGEVNVLDDIDKKIQSRLDKEKKIADNQSLLNDSFGQAGGLLKKMGLGKYAGIFDDMSKNASDLTEKLHDQQESAVAFNKELEEAQKSGERMDESFEDVMGDADIEAEVLSKSLVDGAKAFKKEMLLALDVAIFKGLKNGVKEFGDSRAALAKTFGLSRDDANALRTDLIYAADSSQGMAFSIEDSHKAMQEFNAEIGGAVRLSRDELETFSNLTEELGLTNEQAAQFVKTAKLSGQNATDLTAQYRGQVAILAMQENSAVNQQDVFAEIGNISAANRLSMEGQGKSLANAAFQSQKLGLSQAQMENTANSLLDFESSIAAEMEAELMTGKQLNLEDARRAALMGDQEGLAKAIGREIGTAAEFGEYNVLQQNALAKAFGMSRDELAETLETQEMLGGRFKSIGDATKKYNKLLEEGKSTKEIEVELGSQALADQIAAKAAADRFSDSMTKLKDKLTPIMDLLGSILDGINDMIEGAGKISGLFESIGKYMGIISGIRIFARFKAGLGVLKKMFGFLTKIAEKAGGVASMLGFGSKAAEQTVKSGGDVAKGVVSSTASAGTKATASAGGGIMGSLKGFIGGGVSKIGSFFEKLNPITRLKDALKGVLGKKALGGTLKSLTKRIPLIGSFIEGIFANSDIKGMIASGEPVADINQMVGERVSEGIGSIVGSVGGMAAVQALNVAPGLGLALTPVAGIAGDWLGRNLGGFIARSVGAEGLGKIVRNTFYDKESQAAGIAEDFISRPGQPIQKFRADDIILGATSPFGRGGNDNREVVMLLKDLIIAINKGGDVYLDGAKVGKSLALATSRMG